MKTLFGAILMATVLMFGALPAQAQNQVTNIGSAELGFNFVNTNATSNVVISVANRIQCLNHEEVFVQVSYNLDTAGDANNPLKLWFGRSTDGTNFSIGNTANMIPFFITGTNGTTTVRAGTNLYAGSAAYIAPVVINNTSTNASVTNLLFKFQFKNRRSGL